MKHDVKEDRRLFQTEEGLKEDEVTGAADGQKFCQTLNHSQENRLWDIDFMLLENVKFQSSNVNSNPKLKSQIPPNPPFTKGGRGGDY